MIFRYGVVVLIGLLPSEEKVLIDSLKPRVTGELSPYEEEIAQAQLCKDESAEAIQPGGPICLAKFSDDRLLLIADALAKSTSLARDERRVAAVFDVIEPFARKLAEQGRTPPRRKGILQLIGNALLVQQRVAGRVAVAEKPDVLWEKPELDRLYATPGRRVRTEGAPRHARAQAHRRVRDCQRAHRHHRHPALAPPRNRGGGSDRDRGCDRLFPDLVGDALTLRASLALWFEARRRAALLTMRV
ncbi:hypothetical protein ACVWWG_004927 [Bradyrhizobium sp. LB7.2]